MWQSNCIQTVGEHASPGKAAHLMWNTLDTMNVALSRQSDADNDKGWHEEEIEDKEKGEDGTSQGRRPWEEEGREEMRTDKKCGRARKAKVGGQACSRKANKKSATYGQT